MKKIKILVSPVVTNDLSSTFYESGGLLTRLEATYTQLRAVLGAEPVKHNNKVTLPSKDVRMTTQWVIEAAGMVCSIYYHRLGFIPHAKENQDRLITWSVGGCDASKFFAESLKEMIEAEAEIDRDDYQGEETGYDIETHLDNEQRAIRKMEGEE